MNVYEIRDDNGTLSEIQANSRKEAVETYAKIHGMTQDYIREYCVVKNLGKVIRERWGWIKSDKL